MKHLIIRNLGPIQEADIELKEINVIIGAQSSGKSCVLKTACYCTWVEKRIELTQTEVYFCKNNQFIKGLEDFHKLKGYIKPDTAICYESDFMKFSYDGLSGDFHFEWKKDRWQYKRSKVTYIPAERNLVAAIPNWFQVKFADDNIRDFMADWETARQSSTESVSILNLDVSYHFDANTKSDKVEVGNNVTLDFTNTSSGLQSLIPMFVHLNYLFQNIISKAESFADIQEKNEIQRILAEKNKSELYNNFCHTEHFDIFLEEPEANLFPPTQATLVEWLLDNISKKKQSSLFIATHSPYILNSFIEKKNIDTNLLYINNSGGKICIKKASADVVQAIYDYGVDAFFNIETLG